MAAAEILRGVPLLAAGVLGFSLVEYLIHGILAHRFKTPVTPIHWGHHRTPRAVFTSPVAWLPTACAIWLGCAGLIGPVLASWIVAGLLIGFARYEIVHWRIHFRAPRNARERLLRNHHLAHHFVSPRAYQGVTTRFWDRMFGTLPARWPEDYARVDGFPPLQGASNLREISNPFALIARRRSD